MSCIQMTENVLPYLLPMNKKMETRRPNLNFIIVVKK